MDTLSLFMADMDQEPTPHRVVADDSALYLVPEADDVSALRIPLRETADATPPGPPPSNRPVPASTTGRASSCGRPSTCGASRTPVRPSPT